LNELETVGCYAIVGVIDGVRIYQNRLVDEFCIPKGWSSHLMKMNSYVFLVILLLLPPCK